MFIIRKISIISLRPASKKRSNQAAVNIYFGEIFCYYSPEVLLLKKYLKVYKTFERMD